MILDFYVTVGILGGLPAPVFKAFSPELFALEILFPLLGLFDVALHFSGADTTYPKTAEVGMDHMVDIANDLMTAHFADTPERVSALFLSLHFCAAPFHNCEAGALGCGQILGF